MGRIVSQIKVENAFHPEHHMEFSAMVDTGAAYTTLPMKWREQLGALSEENVEMVTATGETVVGKLCGPVRMHIARFRPIYTEILFVEMEPDANNDYEPLLGYTPLELCGAAVDMLGHRLVPVRYIDLK